jgi:hypothetical protein
VTRLGQNIRESCVTKWTTGVLNLSPVPPVEPDRSRDLAIFKAARDP